MTPGEKKLVGALSSATLTLLVACVFVVFARARAPVLDTRAALADPELREEIVRRLTDTSGGVWDSHNDPEVGRVLQPNLTKAVFTNVLTQTNALGLREKNFALPKPAGTLRIVLLGDSFVQGFGVEAQDRVGVRLERYLAEHARGWNGPIECLHIAVGGWDVVAECAYLRRMLSELAPDLVLHVLVANQLEDPMGVRGFGGIAAFSTLEWQHTDALVYSFFPAKYATPHTSNFLLDAADYESRHRYERVAATIGRVVPLIRQSGARYLNVVHWGFYNAKVWHFLKDVIEPKEFAAFPIRLFKDPDLVLSPSDQHWSRNGHERVARFLFTLIRTQGLLPELALTPWPEAEGPAGAELAEARKAAMHPPKGYWLPPREGLSSLEPAHFTELEWRHVYTGLDDKGRVSPFASFYLARDGQPTLTLRGRALDRPELAGARIRVSVEGLPAGEHELVPGQPFDLRFPLPAEIKRTGGITVRLETSDYGYSGPDLQHCISFLLERLALE